MYKNLEAELTRSGISQDEAAEHLGICLRTFKSKLDGTSDWYLRELIGLKDFINDRLGTDYSLDYLFERYGE